MDTYKIEKHRTEGAILRVPLLRDIPEYPGYKAGDDGSIWSSHNNRWGIGTKWRELRQGSQNIYGRTVVSIKRQDGIIHSRYAHHLILEAFRGPRPPGYEARHLNSNAGDNRLINLTWGSREENLADMRANGLKKGIRHHNAVLTDSDIIAMRTRAASGESHTSIAKDFPVQRRQISRIVQGIRWNHV